MTLEQLRIFVAVAERLHVTQAARALNLAQSAASHAVAALEARHRTKLFNRAGRGIELTEAGEVFLAEARAVLARVEAAELALSDFSGLTRGTLSVHASQTIASYWLPRHLAAFKRAYPRVQIRLAIGNTAQVAAAVENGTAELGFVEGDVETAGLACTPVARDQLLIVVAPDHPWATAGRLTPEDLAAGEWVQREPGSGTRSAFEEAMAGPASRRRRCTLFWNCRRTRRCAQPWKRALAPRRSPPRSPRQVSRQASCTGRISTFPSASSTCCAAMAATGRAPPKHWWRQCRACDARRIFASHHRHGAAAAVAPKARSRRRSLRHLLVTLQFLFRWLAVEQPLA